MISTSSACSRLRLGLCRVEAEAQRTVDDAHMRYFIAHIHRLRDEEQEASSTEELD